MKKSRTTENLHKSVTEVTHKAPLTEGCIDSIFPSGKPVAAKLRSKPIKTNKHSSPYTLLLSESGLNRNFILRFNRVNVRNYSQFIKEPEKFMTIPDMCLVHSVTGISIDKQVHTILYGLTDAELTRKGSRLIGSFKELLDLNSGHKDS